MAMVSRRYAQRSVRCRRRQRSIKEWPNESLPLALNSTMRFGHSTRLIHFIDIYIYIWFQAPLARRRCDGDQLNATRNETSSVLLLAPKRTHNNHDFSWARDR